VDRDAEPPSKRLVTVIPGDGIGPEVVRSAQRIVEASGAAVAATSVTRRIVNPA